VQVRAWDTLGHALIAASDQVRWQSTDSLLWSAHLQEQRRRPPTQHARQAGSAAPCRATWQAALRLVRAAVRLEE